jgi:hypothetical protein
MKILQEKTPAPAYCILTPLEGGPALGVVLSLPANLDSRLVRVSWNCFAVRYLGEVKIDHGVRKHPGCSPNDGLWEKLCLTVGTKATSGELHWRSHRGHKGRIRRE